MSSKGKEKIPSKTITRNVQPLSSLNPYQGNWTIKVFLASKGVLRTYKNMTGEGCVFNVELADEHVSVTASFLIVHTPYILLKGKLINPSITTLHGTRIQATMFNEAAKKFVDKFEMGKVYYISKGYVKVANKQFATVDNEYELTLNQYSQVEEAVSESMLVPERRFNFVPIDQLQRYVNRTELVDVIGVVQHVSATISVKRKISDDIIPKRDITIVDDTNKTVVVTLWNEQATYLGQEIFEMADKHPVLAIKSLRVGNFRGVSLSPLPNSYIRTNPDIEQAHKLSSWYNSKGKETALASTASGFSPSIESGEGSMDANRVTLDRITTDSSLGEDKPVLFTVRACMTYINPQQTMTYLACKTCKRKVTKGDESGYWCSRCQKKSEDCNIRYTLVAKFCDVSGGAWFSLFNEEAEKLLTCSAENLLKMKSQGSEFQIQLKKAKWIPHLLRVSIAPKEYNNVKRQNIIVRSITAVDFAAESRVLLEEISLKKQCKAEALPAPSTKDKTLDVNPPVVSPPVKINDKVENKPALNMESSGKENQKPLQTNRKGGSKTKKQPKPDALPAPSTKDKTLDVNLPVESPPVEINDKVENEPALNMESSGKENQKPLQPNRKGGSKTKKPQKSPRDEKVLSVGRRR